MRYRTPGGRTSRYAGYGYSPGRTLTPVRGHRREFLDLSDASRAIRRAEEGRRSRSNMIGGFTKVDRNVQSPLI